MKSANKKHSLGVRHHLRRSLYLVIPRILGVLALSLLVASASTAQPPASSPLVRIGGASPNVYEVDIPRIYRTSDSTVGFFALPGEWLPLARGRHRLSFVSTFAQALRIELEVTDSSVLMLSQSLADHSACGGDIRPILDSWTAKLIPSTDRTNAFDLILTAPVQGKGAMSVHCSQGPGQYSQFRNLTLTVKSNPSGATILEEGRSIGTTDRSVSIVYPVAEGRLSRDKRLRIAMPGRAGGCRYLLSELLRTSSTTLTCELPP